MLPLNKYFNKAEFLAFIEYTRNVRSKELEFTAKPKIDGIAFNALYCKG